jgi:polyisoprenoid-binding protein YceI
MKSIKWIISLAALSMIGFQAQAQTFTKYQSTSESTMSVTGTSTLHNWSEKLKKCDVSFQATESGNQSIEIKDVSVKVLVTDLETESSIMADKTYDALKKKKYPEMTFVSNQETTLPLSGTTFSGKISGKLTIAGTTKQVQIPIQGTMQNGTASVSGVYPVSMPEYGVKPPTAMFGAIKSGKEIKIHFDVKFNKVQP